MIATGGSWFALLDMMDPEWALVRDPNATFLDVMSAWEGSGFYPECPSTVADAWLTARRNEDEIYMSGWSYVPFEA